ncbi:MAG: OFA family MFS transporter [Desulfobacterales bacterium]|nr:OFA family MFS transporter [Desulfobacterales bacterium]
MTQNKYVVLVGALLAQVTIAGLYAWSVFGIAIERETGWSGDEILLTYSIAQFVFALSTIVSGRLVDTKGPRFTIIIGGVLYGGGLILSSFATSPFMLYITYGVIAGAGVGFVYVCPIATLVKWFPQKKGTIIGLSVAVFGGGSIIFKDVIAWLLVDSDVSTAFLHLGLVTTVIIIIGGSLTSVPEGFKKSLLEKTKEDYTTSEMVKTPKFYLTWIMFWLAVIPGILVLGAAKNIGIEVAGLGDEAAATIISILAISNASSRLISGALSDKVGTLNVLKGQFVVTILALLSLSFLAETPAMFYLGVVGIAVGYGGFLALFPTFTNQQWGIFRYGSNYGIVYQAYALSALTGIFIKSTVGTFINTFIVAAIAAAIGLGVAFFVKERKTAPPITIRN